ncbi:MAG: Do family serine endopeptidase [Myxococcota bacterium]|nr:Do family serine endopeptidase [Myxococcota bacterium]
MKTNRLNLALIAILSSSLSWAQQPPQPSGEQQPTSATLPVLPSLAPLVESVKAAVVNVDIAARGRGRAGPRSPQEDMFERFFGGGQQGQEQLRQGMGSGFIIDSSGTILTNNHVVEGAVQIQVRLDDGRTFDAEVLGRDPLTDVAVIKLKGKNVKDLPYVKLGDSDASRPGDWALAIGNPFGLASSVSLGIVSATARDIQAGPYDDFIQTDAAINPGNSGGPLFNLKGEVIGINTAIVGGGSGIGFAVPSNLVRALLPMLMKEGVVSRGYLGVGIQTLTAQLSEAMGVPSKTGAIVLSVADDSPARKAGVLKPDDVIVGIDGKKIDSADMLTRLVALKRPGTAVQLTYYRGTKRLDGKITLGTRPDIEQLGLSPRSEDDGESADARQQKLGFTIQDMDPRFAGSGMPAEGAIITNVMPASPADHAQLLRGMVVVEANKKPVKRAAELMQILRAAKPGSRVLLRVRVPGGQAAGLRVITIPE